MIRTSWGRYWRAAPRILDLSLDSADAYAVGALDPPRRPAEGGRPARTDLDQLSVPLFIAHRCDWARVEDAEALRDLDHALVMQQHDRARRAGLRYRKDRPVRHLAPSGGRHTELPRSRTLTRYRDSGRSIYAALGAGPWALYSDGRLGRQRAWWTRPEVLDSLERWLGSWRAAESPWTVRDVLSAEPRERAYMLRSLRPVSLVG